MLDWVYSPMTANPDELPTDAGEELLRLQSDLSARKFAEVNGTFQMWLQYHRKFPRLWSHLEKFYIAFPTTWQVESGFSSMRRLLTNERSSLRLESSGDLRVQLSTKTPNIDALTTRHTLSVYSPTDFS